jgi:hypothetical protein
MATIRPISGQTRSKRWKDQQRKPVKLIREPCVMDTIWKRVPIRLIELPLGAFRHARRPNPRAFRRNRRLHTTNDPDPIKIGTSETNKKAVPNPEAANPSQNAPAAARKVVPLDNPQMNWSRLRGDLAFAEA